ncbi:MAG: hypothetical protein HC913_10605 [Microscillaceae bacterium]|nr:hypothetical protein [Microscillaceae bacterium]
MFNTFKESLGRQFGASLDMLENALTLGSETGADQDKKFFILPIIL